jgi:hypothetical protein
MRILNVVALLALLAAAPASADPNSWALEGWKTDFDNIVIDPGEITTVILRDQIPSIDDPKFIPVAEETDLPEREPVMSLEIDGDARAYPLRIMMWHEIVNDTVGGMPVAVTYCPLCNASIVFDRTIDGKAVEFGTSGKLRNSDLVMYDRDSQTWWQQFSGKGLVGKHAGDELTMIPSRLDSWGRFKKQYPDGKVLVPNNERMRAYWRNPYSEYDSSVRPFLFGGTLPVGIPALERVIMVRGDEPFAVALPVLEQEKRIEEGDIVVTWEPGQASALDTPTIADGRDVGNVEAYRMVDGEKQPVVHDVTFAFVVNAFEPTLTIRTQ